MVQVRRIAYATFETPDVRRLTDYYVEVLGLAVAAQDGNAAFLASPIGQPMVVLRRGDAARCAQLTFQVDPQADPGEVVRALARHDIATQRRTDPNPFAAESILLHDRDGLAVEVRSPHTSLPTIYLFDMTPGGVGFSERLFRSTEPLLQRAAEHLAGCPCAEGCPSCVGPAYALGAKVKASVVELLRQLA